MPTKLELIADKQRNEHIARNTYNLKGESIEFRRLLKFCILLLTGIKYLIILYSHEKYSNKHNNCAC